MSFIFYRCLVQVPGDSETYPSSASYISDGDSGEDEPAVIVGQTDGSSLFFDCDLTTPFYPFQSYFIKLYDLSVKTATELFKCSKEAYALYT